MMSVTPSMCLYSYHLARLTFVLFHLEHFLPSNLLQKFILHRIEHFISWVFLKLNKFYDKFKHVMFLIVCMKLQQRKGNVEVFFWLKLS